MSAKTIKSALGLLQDDPDRSGGWEQLRQLVDESRDNGEMDPGELLRLLDAARHAHEARREVEAVAALLEIEADAAKRTSREPEFLAELARVLDEELLDDDRACAAYERLRALGADERHASEAVERSAAKRARWRDLVERYIQE